MGAPAWRAACLPETDWIDRKTFVCLPTALPRNEHVDDDDCHNDDWPWWWWCFLATTRDLSNIIRGPGTGNSLKDCAKESLHIMQGNYYYKLSRNNICNCNNNNNKRNSYNNTSTTTTAMKTVTRNQSKTHGAQRTERTNARTNFECTQLQYECIQLSWQLKILITRFLRDVDASRKHIYHQLIHIYS